MNKTIYTKETELCKKFIESVKDAWTCYPETGGFDILLARKEDGFQIGVEAKLVLNAKVITQVAERIGHYYADSPGPDCRAILVPERSGITLAGVCELLGITVIRMYEPHSGLGFRSSSPFRPELPDGHYWNDGHWYEFCPLWRLSLPDYIPDVEAGSSSPVALTPWKIGAIKLDITMKKRGFITRKDFKYFEISMSRWITPACCWLMKNGEGGWTAGPTLPDFEKQHPVNYKQIEKDYDKWKNPESPTQQKGLFKK